MKDPTGECGPSSCSRFRSWQREQDGGELQERRCAYVSTAVWQVDRDFFDVTNLVKRGVRPQVWGWEL